MNKNLYVTAISALCIVTMLAAALCVPQLRNNPGLSDDTSQDISDIDSEYYVVEITDTEGETTVIYDHPPSWTDDNIYDHPPLETEEPVHNHKFKTTVLAQNNCMHGGRAYQICEECGYDRYVLLYRKGHNCTTTIKPEADGKIYNRTYCFTCQRWYVEEMSYTLHVGEEDGITREKMIAWLSSHEHDEYYLGTVYKGHAYAFPQGAANYSQLTDEEQKLAVEAAGLYVKSNKNGQYKHKYGKPGVNCSGLIGHFMYAVNPHFIDTFNKNITSSSYLGFKPSPSTTNQSVTNAWNWYILVTRNSVSSHAQKYDEMGKYFCYKFPTREEMMSSGVLKKGDIVLAMPQYKDDDMHLGMFWGDTSDEDIFWVSEKNGVELKFMHDPAKIADTTYWYVMPLIDQAEYDLKYGSSPSSHETEPE